MYKKPKKVVGPHLHHKNSQLGTKMPQHDPQKAKKNKQAWEAISSKYSFDSLLFYILL